MPDAIGFIVEFAIKDGRLDAFKDVITTMTATVEKTEPGALSYRWFLSPDDTVCTIHEWYAGDDAVLAHFTGEAVANHMGALLAESGINSFHVYGTPGEKAASILSNLPVTVTHTLAAGFAR